MLDTLRHASYTQADGYPCPHLADWKPEAQKDSHSLLVPQWEHRRLGPLTLSSQPFPPAELSQEVGVRLLQQMAQRVKPAGSGSAPEQLAKGLLMRPLLDQQGWDNAWLRAGSLRCFPVSEPLTY